MRKPALQGLEGEPPKAVEEDVVIVRPDWDDFYGFGAAGPAAIGATGEFGTPNPTGDWVSPYGVGNGVIW